MYVRNVYASPAPGKAEELEALSREIITAQQAAGAVVGLTMRVFSGTQSFVARTIVPDMAGVAALRTQATSPKGRATVAKVQSLLREPLTVMLSQILIPAPNGVAGAYALFARLHPAPGKMAELLALAAAETKAQQEQGIAVLLSRSVISPEGGLLTAAYPLADLPALEQLTQRLSADPRWQGAMSQMGSLLRQPIQTILEEVLIPVPKLGAWE